MPRATRSGSVGFGLVSVPVKLYGAGREKRVSFHQLEEGTGARIRYRRVSEESGEEVPPERIVKGYEIAKGRFVEVTEEEVRAAEPEETRMVEIEDFVDLTVDPLYFSDASDLEPDGRGAEKAYALLVRAMRDAGRIALGRFVMRSREYLVALRPLDGALVLHTMHFGDEVVDASDLDRPSGVEASKREVAAARQLIDSLTAKWDPDRYRDTFRERLLEVIERKAEGEDIVTRPAAREEAEVIDLMAALEASLGEPRGKKAPPSREAADDLDRLTKSELYERASDLDVEGRSQRTKDQLVKAVRGAQSRTRRTA